MTPPSLATHARRVLDAAAVARGETLLVACSGGVDSQVLLDVLAHLAGRGRVRVVAHGVDHGLRPEAMDELALARALADSRGVPFGITRVDVAPGSNLQARARALRFDALRKAASSCGARHIATAHHRDDRAETVLIRLLRGAPLAGLAVLPPVSNDLVRPFAAARRGEIEGHARKRAIPHASDPSNLDPRFLRARVRAELLPLMQALDPRIVDHLAAVADDALGSPQPHLAASFVDHLDGNTSSRARHALAEAAARENLRARVLLPGGRVARWDASTGVVITPDARSRRTERSTAASAATNEGLPPSKPRAPPPPGSHPSPRPSHD